MGLLQRLASVGAGCRLTTLLVAFVILASCESAGPSAPGESAAIRIVPENPRIEIESTIQLEAAVLGESGSLNPSSVFWSSEAPEVVSVSASGVVTGHGIGSVRVAASFQGTGAVTTVEVIPVPVASIRIAPTSAQLIVGTTQTFSAVALYDD